MINSPTNLQVLKPSRAKVKPGDLFVMKMAIDSYLVGRVISVEAIWTFAVGADPAILIYIYRDRAESKENIPKVRRDRLLVSPILTNRLPWSRGYFETVGNWPLGPEDVLPRHCFKDVLRGRYFDDRGRELPGPIEPVGVFALDSYQTIDDQVSDALGIPQAPGE